MNHKQNEKNYSGAQTEVICHKCGEVGHFSHGCARVLISSGRNCHICHQPGHFSRECKSKGKSGECLNCRKPGHYARDCLEEWCDDGLFSDEAPVGRVVFSTNTEGKAQSPNVEITSKHLKNSNGIFVVDTGAELNLIKRRKLRTGGPVNFQVKSLADRPNANITLQRNGKVMVK